MIWATTTISGSHWRTHPHREIEEFKLYGEVNGRKLLADGTVIGYKRICRFEELRVQRIKLVIESTRCFATISKFECY